MTSPDYSLEAALQHPRIQLLRKRLEALRPLEAPVMPDSRLAAVVALLRVVGEGPDDVEIFFIKRAVVARDPWSGHIAFPGGRREVIDASLEQTAIRETREEVSVDIEQSGRIIGQLDDLAPRSPSLPPVIVRPFVAVVPASIEIAANPEVADAFWTQLSALDTLAGRAEHELLVNGAATRFPAYAVREHIVWGLTERIVSQLLPLFAMP